MLDGSFVAAFRRHFPDLLGQRLVVALSGGADSTALTLLAYRSREPLQLDLALAHVHHGVRGPEADADALFCQQLAAQLGLPFFLHRLPPPPAKVSTEAWWRQQRYRALEAVRQEVGAAAVATAHTRDDQAETVLLKLLRGSGPRGVAGIRRRLGSIIRPLLDFRRQQLTEYLRQLGQGYRQDLSNLAPNRPRTFLRWQVLPLLEQAFGRVVDHLAAFGEELGEDEALLDQLTRQGAPLPRLGLPVAVDQVAALPRPLRRRWLQALAAGFPLQEPPSRAQFDLFCGLVEGREPRAVDLGGRWVVQRQRRQLVLTPPPVKPFAPLALVVPGLLQLPGGFSLGVGRPVRRADHRAFLHPRLLQGQVQVVSAPPGLRFLGRYVREALAQQGIPPQWRAAWPVLVVDGTIVWVPAVGVLPAWAQTSGVLVELEEPWERHGKSSPPRPSPSG
ncbi:MAG: tRNA lysidine(34) synthetase TilS [Thermoanaerobaculum sp.]|nr:tRNA lysidine(34) synthetase TilS [Thermoanaerobaculum sp.]